MLFFLFTNEARFMLREKWIIELIEIYRFKSTHIRILYARILFQSSKLNYVENKSSIYLLIITSQSPWKWTQKPTRIMMGYLYTGSFLAVIVTASFLVCTCQARDGEAEKIWEFRLKYHVHIINGFKNNSKPLMVHCWSGDDDIGQHSLHVGQQIAWHFRVNWLGSTQFTCKVKHGTRAKQFYAFSAPIEGSECAGDGQCYWLIVEDGFYFSKDDFTWMRKFAW